ncbi:hypothetical protein DAY19_11595 [Halobacteriovorax vibrionivorans]|uniref:Uncharacterized protein n=1 Tax=Halobacteriovorax vibrionivorans TaxID=2152716 RepID=A0ABY0IDA2_9BACT|nr:MULTISPECIES: hypothetical protein [Halobacteriovorax]RZF20622.1 hypothetical protein DAY19_11595 [Halobacteriovorax vibrionivorans]TGD48967.1 hypothetical protein EP118_02135 [Halobacteriovorax sp. Y22]
MEKQTSLVSVKKRGRRPKNEKKEYQLNKEQTKFFVDLSNDNESLETVFNVLEQVNQKEYGRDIIFKDLALYGLSKLNEKDIEKIKDSSLNEMERVERALVEHNKKTGNSLNMGEFLIKKLGI